MEIEVQSTRENRDDIVVVIAEFGEVTDLWPDGTFNFKAHNDEDYEDAIAELDDLGVEYKSL